MKRSGIIILSLILLLLFTDADALNRLMPDTYQTALIHDNADPETSFEDSDNNGEQDIQNHPRFIPVFIRHFATSPPVIREVVLLPINPSDTVTPPPREA